MFLKIALFFCLSILYLPVSAQVLHELNAALDFMEIDKLENIYVVKGSEITKYDKQGAFLYSYANNMNGNLYAVDVTDPLRILLFYKEANLIVYLNQQLAVLSDPIDIYEIALAEAAMVGSSSQGGFWVYSANTQSLMLISRQWVKVQESQNLNSWIEGSEIYFIREYNQKVYIGLSEKVIVCDMFGAYLTTLHFKNATSLKIVNGQINYIENDKLRLFNPENKSESGFEFLLNENQRAAFYFNKKTYVATKQKLLIYPSE